MRFAIASLMALFVLAATAERSAAETPTPKESALAPRTFDELLASLRGSVGVEARFTEKKIMALLATPLVSEGVIYFSPPGLLARYVTAPSPSFQIIDPARVRFGSGASIETLDLARRPEVRGFVESFVALLAGDRASLERAYTVEFTAPRDASGGAWVVTLRPRSAPVNKVIATLTLKGNGMVVNEMRMVELEGDETITTFTKVEPQRKFSEDERDRLFKRRSP